MDRGGHQGCREGRSHNWERRKCVVSSALEVKETFGRKSKVLSARLKILVTGQEK